MQLTEEQLFDYHHELLGPTEMAQVKDHLSSHPKDQKRLQAIQAVEQAYQSAEWDGPSDQVLYKVRQAARDEVHVSFWSVVKERFEELFTLKQLSVGLSAIFVVVGLSYALKTLQNNSSAPGVTGGHVAAEKLIQDQKASFSGTLTEQTLSNPQAPQTVQDALSQYNQAMYFYHQNQLARAVKMYESIALSHPDFEKKSELYSFWVLALRKMGQNEKADQIESSIQ